MDGNHSPHKNILIKHSEWNEGNQYSFPGSKKPNINDGKEHTNAHKNTIEEEILQVNTDNFLEMLLDIVNKNVQETLKKFPDTKNK
jgi:hypothetical protein